MKRFLTITLMLVCTLMTRAQTDVDTRIAVNDQKDPNTFVVIISNENYKNEQPVPFALNDGSVFKQYCEKTLGIPAKNIHYSPDATLNDMRMQLVWLDKVMKAFQGEARAIVYYSGHGMPSDDGKHAYLLPVDGYSQFAESGLSTEQLYGKLGGMPSKGTIVLLDACFSGARRDGKMLASSRGVAIKAKEEAVTGNVVVFSAAQGDETAYPYQERKHGLFTYHLLSALKDKGGCISMGELSDRVTKQVTRASIVENSKSQTPTVIASANSDDWRNWMFAQNPARKDRNRKQAPETVTPLETPVQMVSTAQAQTAQPVQPGARETTQETDVANLIFERKLKSSDLSGLSKKDLEILRNMIYARHGYKFKRADLRDYFSQFSWYQPVSGDANAAIGQMSNIERYNVDFIKAHEK